MLGSLGAHEPRLGGEDPRMGRCRETDHRLGRHGIQHVLHQHFEHREAVEPVGTARNLSGIWVDAYTVPLRPLDNWLPPLMPSGFFAHHDPYRKRMAETWFLAAQPDNPLITGWRDRIGLLAHRAATDALSPRNGPRPKRRTGAAGRAAAGAGSGTDLGPGAQEDLRHQETELGSVTGGRRSIPDLSLSRHGNAVRSDGLRRQRSVRGMAKIPQDHIL